MSIMPSDGRDWLLLVAGFVVGYWVLAHKRTTGKAVPGTGI